MTLRDTNLMMHGEVTQGVVLANNTEPVRGRVKVHVASFTPMCINHDYTNSEEGRRSWVQQQPQCGS